VGQFALLSDGMGARTAERSQTRVQPAPAPERSSERNVQIKLPPGPRSPVLWQTRRYRRDPFSFLEDVQRRHGVGGSATINILGFGQTVWVTDPELIKEVYGRDDEMPLSPAGNLVKPIFGSKSVTGLDGHPHLKRRKLLLPRFHGAAIAGLESDFVAAAERTMARWEPGEEVDLHPEMFRLTLDFLFEVLLDVTDPEETDALTKASMELIAMMSLCAVGDWIRRDFGPASPWAYFLRRRRALDTLLYAQIAAHREALERDRAPEDILTMLLEARFDDDTALTDEEIRDELVTLIIAGSETTATSMAWTFDLLMHRPGAVSRVVAEAAVGESTFTDAAIKESLRLRPPVIASGRVTNRTVELGPWTIPENVRIWTPMSLIQRDPDVYENPNEFRPERFLETKPPAFMWIPFGGGVRRCLAAPFAMLEMRVVVQTVLSRLRLTSLTETSETTRADGAIIVPDGGVRVRTEPREHTMRTAHPLDELLESAEAPAPERQPA
jgi:cytochrome P450